jgi:hypothetical protein
MAYSDYTLPDLEDKYGVVRKRLFETVAPILSVSER